MDSGHVSPTCLVSLRIYAAVKRFECPLKEPGPRPKEQSVGNIACMCYLGHIPDPRGEIVSCLLDAEYDQL